jgi:hypothetical protein
MLRTYPSSASGTQGARRGGGVLDGDPPRGGGALRAGPDLRHRHERAGAAPGARRDLPARADAGVHDNYISAGGARSFSEYYTAGYDGALFHPALLRNVVFAQHNLVTDRSFSEFNAILCRNVLIYFDKSLQTRVHRLFYDSLATFGVLALGGKETLRFSAFEDRFEPAAAAEKIYRKVR